MSGIVKDEAKILKTRCNICREVFVVFSLSKVCPSCLKKEDDLGKSLRDYISTHQGVRIDELCAEFNISHKDVIRFERQGFFNFVSSSGRML